MLPNSNGRATRASSSRGRTAEQRNDEKDNENEESDQDQVAGNVPPVDAQAQAAAHPAAAPQAQAGALPPAPMPPPDQVVLSRAAVQQLFVPQSEKISSLVKRIVTLAHGNFSAWHKALNGIAYYRRWDKSRVMNTNYTWDQIEEDDPHLNQQRRDAFWVLTSSMPHGTDFYHLQTGIEEGDANELYKKVIRIFLAKNPQNRGELRKQFYNLSMASTKLDVSRFAAKVVQTAGDLQKIGAQLEDDETVTRFLDGLSKKFDDIVTVERVAKNDFDTTLTNVIEYANTNKLMSYRETSTHGYHHMAREPPRSLDQSTPRKNNHKKKFFKKKSRPSKQFQQWSNNGSGFQGRDQRKPTHDSRKSNYGSKSYHNNNNHESKYDNHAKKSDHKRPFMCMHRAQDDVDDDATLSPPDAEEEESCAMRTLQQHHDHIKAIAVECKQTRIQNNRLIMLLDQERKIRRGLEQQVAINERQIDKLKDHQDTAAYRVDHLFQKLLPLSDVDSLLPPPTVGRYKEDLDTTDEDLAENDPTYFKHRSEHYGRKRMPWEEKQEEALDPHSIHGYTMLVATSKSTESAPTTGKLHVALAHNEEEWMTDSGASYHLTMDENDYDEGSIESCNISLTIGDNQEVRITKYGRCTRFTKEGRKVILTQVLHARSCPTRILGVGRLTKKGLSMFTQDKEVVQLIEKKTGEIILQGVVTPQDTANVCLRKPLPTTNPTLMTNLGPTQEELLLLHRQWGHVSFDKCRAMLGLPPTQHAIDDLCNDCWKAELKEPKKSKETTTRADLNLYRIHMDLTGVKANNVKGYRLALILVDDKSRYTWMIPLHNRAQWIDKVIQWKKMIETQHPPYKVAKFRTDSEPTIVGNTTWIEWLEKEGIVHEVAAPYSQFQNGVVERRIGILGKMTKAMLYTSGLPAGDWYHAMEYATYLLNRTFSRSYPSAEGYLSPYQVFYQRGDEFTPEGVFGCHTMGKIYVKGKMAPQAADCIWLGRRENIKADLLRKIATNKESYSRVNKINPTIFPNMNCDVNRPIQAQPDSEDLQNWGPIESESQRNYPPTNENSDRDLYLDKESPGPFESKIDENGEHYSSDSGYSRRIRTPSLTAVESLASQLQISKVSNSPISNSFLTTPGRASDGSLLPDPSSKANMLKYEDSDDWILSEEKELYSIAVKHKGFTYRRREPSMNVLPSHFIYKYKRDPHGNLTSRKTRFVAGGHKQEYEVDYFDTYAATTQLESVRLMLGVAASVGAKLAKFDIETFFLYSKPDTDIFIEQPPGHEIVPEGAPTHHTVKDYVVQLNVSLYGCKQSPRLANLDVTKFFAEIGLVPMVTDPQAFILGHFPSCFVIVLLFVDDGMCVYNNSDLFENMLTKLQKKYTLKVTYQPKDFLSLEIEYHPTHMKLHQTGYVNQLLTDFKMTNCNPVPTPITASQVKVITETPASLKDQPNVNEFPMLTLCGRLLWLVRLSRFDILFATNFLCRYMSVANKLEKLMPIVKRILRYLAGTRDRGLIYPISKGTDLIVSAQVDSDFSGDTTKRSTYCRYTYLDNCLINFCTKLQKSVATSTCNAEFNGITEAVTDILYYRVCVENLKGRTWPLSLSPFAVNYPPCDCKRAKEIKEQLSKWKPAPPSVLFSDSQTAIACVKNNKTTPGTKNETNKSAFVHEICNSGLVTMQHLDGTKLCPDAGTKALPPDQFEALINAAQPTSASLMNQPEAKGNAMIFRARNDDAISLTSFGSLSDDELPNVEQLSQGFDAMATNDFYAQDYHGDGMLLPMFDANNAPAISSSSNSSNCMSDSDRPSINFYHNTTAQTPDKILSPEIPVAPVPLQTFQPPFNFAPTSEQMNVNNIPCELKANDYRR